MTQRTYEDPILELAMRLGEPGVGVIELADTTDEEAETVLEVLDEVEAEFLASSIVSHLRRQGHWL